MEVKCHWSLMFWWYQISKPPPGKFLWRSWGDSLLHVYHWHLNIGSKERLKWFFSSFSYGWSWVSLSHPASWMQCFKNGSESYFAPRPTGIDEEELMTGPNWRAPWPCSLWRMWMGFVTRLPFSLTAPPEKCSPSFSACSRLDISNPCENQAVIPV